MSKAKPATVNRCSLVLHINGIAYRVRKIDGQAAHVRAWRLTKPDGESYDVSVGRYGDSCTCGDFVWRREGLTDVGCKHCRAARAVGLID
jgi:hypothetical protein